MELTELDRSRIPTHVAVVMDGNGRWAQRRGLPRTDGHAAGEEALMDAIWGALDARSPLSVAREFERRIPGATLAVIPDCGHVSNLEAPEQFNEAVRGFCRAVASEHVPQHPPAA